MNTDSQFLGDIEPTVDDDPCFTFDSFDDPRRQALQVVEHQIFLTNLDRVDTAVNGESDKLEQRQTRPVSVSYKHQRVAEFRWFDH